MMAKTPRVKAEVASNLTLAELVALSFQEDLPDIQAPTVMERERKQ
jgi:hypothetical protein